TTGGNALGGRHGKVSHRSVRGESPLIYLVAVGGAPRELREVDVPRRIGRRDREALLGAVGAPRHPTKGRATISPKPPPARSESTTRSRKSNGGRGIRTPKSLRTPVFKSRGVVGQWGTMGYTVIEFQAVSRVAVLPLYSALYHLLDP